MDVATLKQKVYIRDLFVKGGLPDCIFNPLHRWRIDYEDANSVIHNLWMMIIYDHEELKDEICQKLLGKNIFQKMTKTIEELEEEEDQATYDLTADEWLNEQINNDVIPENIWNQEWNEKMFAENEVIA